MDRRLAGIAVVVVALLAVVVVPSINGKRVAGSAVAKDFPTPPQVGDCLVDPFPTTIRRSGLPPEIPVTATRFGSCSGPILGQVVGEWPDRAAADAELAGRSQRWGACYRQVAGFAGLQVGGQQVLVPGAPQTDPVSWKPTIGFDAYYVVPGDEERAAGRDWVACLAVATGRQPYRGTLAAAYTTGTLPDKFGLCWAGDDLDVLPSPLACDQPHPAELLATGWIRNRSLVTRTEIEASCVTIAGLILRTTDPTRAGALSIVLDPVRADGASTPDAPMMVNCFAAPAGTQALNGTVIGLGDHPVPLTE